MNILLQKSQPRFKFVSYSFFKIWYNIFHRRYICHPYYEPNYNARTEAKLRLFVPDSYAPNALLKLGRSHDPSRLLGHNNWNKRPREHWQHTKSNSQLEFRVSRTKMVRLVEPNPGLYRGLKRRQRRMNKPMINGIHVYIRNLSYAEWYQRDRYESIPAI